MLRSYFLHPAVDKEPRRALKGRVDLQFLMSMAFDDLAFRPGVTDDKSRDSPVNVHFFIDAMVGHEDQLLSVFFIIPGYTE